MIPLPSQHDDDESNEAGGVWGFILGLFFFKLATVAVILWHMHTWESGLIVGSTLWYWFPPLLILGAGPILFYLRLRRVRARRAALQRAEWMIEDQDVIAPTTRKR